MTTTPVYNTLEEIQQELKRRGITKVHFSFDLESSDISKEQLEQEAIAILSSYLNGECRPMPLLGDCLSEEDRARYQRGELSEADVRNMLEARRPKILRRPGEAPTALL